MIDQSHNVTDPIESLMVSAMEIERAYVQALLVDRAALDGFQEANDALMATPDAEGRRSAPTSSRSSRGRALDKGAAIDPVAAYRRSGYRARVAAERPAVAGGGGGIV